MAIKQFQPVADLVRQGKSFPSGDLYPQFKEWEIVLSGTAAAGDAWELIPIDACRHIVGLQLFADSGIAATNPNCSIGIIAGKIGVDDATRVLTDANALALDAVIVSGKFYIQNEFVNGTAAASHFANLVADVDNDNPRAFGIVWDAARTDVDKTIKLRLWLQKGAKEKVVAVDSPAKF